MINLVMRLSKEVEVDKVLEGLIHHLFQTFLKIFLVTSVAGVLLEDLVIEGMI